MSVPFQGTLKRSAGIYSAIGKQIRQVNLKPVKKVSFKFDPFHPQVKSTRDCLFFFSFDKIRETNPRCLFKTDILCNNSDPKIVVNLENGKEIVFKATNLTSLEILQQFNSIILPLVPKDDIPQGKIADKLSGKAGGKAGGKAQTKSQKKGK